MDKTSYTPSCSNLISVLPANSNEEDSEALLLNNATLYLNAPKIKFREQVEKIPCFLLECHASGSIQSWNLETNFDEVVISQFMIDDSLSEEIERINE